MVTRRFFDGAQQEIGSLPIVYVAPGEEELVSGPSEIYVRIDGAWRKGIVYTRVAGEWKAATSFAKVTDTWKP